MTKWQRFWIGGGGALLPVMATLLAVDLSSVIDHYKDYTVGIYIGTSIRYMLLFILGGVVAALNYDEVQPIKLVQLGIAAPALVASYVNAAPSPKIAFNETKSAVTWNSYHAFDFIPAAQAKRLSDPPIVVAGGLFDDILRGIQGPSAIQRGVDNTTVILEQKRSELNSKLLQLSAAAQKSATDAEAALQKAKADAAAAAAAAADRLSPQLTAAAKQSALIAEEAVSKAAADAKAVRDAAAALEQLLPNR